MVIGLLSVISWVKTVRDSSLLSGHYRPACVSCDPTFPFSSSHDVYRMLTSRRLHNLPPTLLPDRPVLAEGHRFRNVSKSVLRDLGEIAISDWSFQAFDNVQNVYFTSFLLTVFQIQRVLITQRYLSEEECKVSLSHPADHILKTTALETLPNVALVSPCGSGGLFYFQM